MDVRSMKVTLMARPRHRLEGLGVVGIVLRGGALLAGVSLLVLLTARPAGAHPALLRSDPAGGATVATSPPTVRLWFTEPLAPEAGFARLADGDGRAIGGISIIRQDDPRLLEVGLPGLATGTYGLTWQVRGMRDSHPTSGTLVFVVGANTFVAGPAVLEAAPRWARLVLVAVLAGALVVALCLRRAGRILVAAHGCAWLGVFTGMAELTARVMGLRIQGSAWSAAYGDLLFGTHWGFLWQAREFALLAVALLLAAPRRAKVVTACALTLALVAAEAYGGAADGVATRTGSADDLVVTVSVTPDEPGLNGFTVAVSSTRRPAPAPVDHVRLVVGVTEVELAEIGQGRYFGTATIGVPGPDQIGAVVERAGRRQTVTIAWP